MKFCTPRSKASFQPIFRITGLYVTYRKGKSTYIKRNTAVPIHLGNHKRAMLHISYKSGLRFSFIFLKKHKTQPLCNLSEFSGAQGSLLSNFIEHNEKLYKFDFCQTAIRLGSFTIVTIANTHSIVCMAFRAIGLFTIQSKVKNDHLCSMAGT